MRVPVAFVIAAALPGAAFAQTADDWDLARDPAKNLTIAAVMYENFGVAVRCSDGTLSTLVTGLPEGAGLRTIGYQIGTTPERETRWVSDPRGSQVAFSIWPASTAVTLSEGGALTLRVRDGQQMRRVQTDLPPSTTAIREVFQACGRSFDSPDEGETPSRENMGGLRWSSPPKPSFPSRSASEFGLAALTCDTRATGGLRDCRVESEFPENGGFGRAATLGAHRTGRVAGIEPSTPLEGRTISFTVIYRLEDETAYLARPSRIRREGQAN